MAGSAREWPVCVCCLDCWQIFISYVFHIRRRTEFDLTVANVKWHLFLRVYVTDQACNVSSKREKLDSVTSNRSLVWEKVGQVLVH